eukprot:TRINITY_DN312_c0_g1_i1.p1 TRINITY_DN312_c0_g1~~TRINITY_DN312_c0_g1_i1.p1  ORF type:complete len:298 (+),score=70.98 TRINITY_DN312_c0_g1_i1:71-895(+)
MPLAFNAHAEGRAGVGVPRPGIRVPGTGARVPRPGPRVQTVHQHVHPARGRPLARPTLRQKKGARSQGVKRAATEDDKALLLASELESTGSSVDSGSWLQGAPAPVSGISTDEEGAAGEEHDAVAAAHDGHDAAAVEHNADEEQHDAAAAADGDDADEAAAVEHNADEEQHDAAAAADDGDDADEAAAVEHNADEEQHDAAAAADGDDAADEEEGANWWSSLRRWCTATKDWLLRVTTIRRLAGGEAAAGRRGERNESGCLWDKFLRLVLGLRG